MAASVLVDAGFLVALLSRQDRHHRWAVAVAAHSEPPWQTCEAALSEAFHLLGEHGAPALVALVRRRSVTVGFQLEAHADAVMKFMTKYADVPASLADAVLVRMTEVFDDPILLTTDGDFRIYRRHGRQIVPAETP
jgi:uncharacterized protein